MGAKIVIFTYTPYLYRLFREYTVLKHCAKHWVNP